MGVDAHRLHSVRFGVSLGVVRMVTVSEVVVSLRSDGADDTQDDLEGLSDSTEEVTQNLDEQTEKLTDFAQSWSGALTAVTVGLLAATGGLLSQIPLVGQAFDGLFAILQAVALQIDQVLRPVFGFVPGLLFAIAEAIGGAKGPIGDLIGLFSIIVPVVLAAAGVVLGLLAKFLGLKTAIATLIGAGGLLISMLSAVAGAISLPAVAVAALALAIGAFIAGMITNFGGFRDKVLSILSTLASKFVSGFKSFLQDPIGFISDFISAVVDLLFNTDWLGLGGKVGSAIVSGLKSKLGLGGEGDGGALDFNTKDILPDVDTSFSSAGNYEFGKSFKKQRNMEMTEPNTQLPGSGKSITEVYLDGRQLGQGTSGERFDESARRGQTF